MPAFGLGSEVAVSLPQVLPWSLDHDSTILPWRLRKSACNPPGCASRVGWITPNSFPSLIGPVLCHVWPRSAVRSKWARQPLSSVLDGHSSSPPSSSIGLFLMGPRTPFGSRRASLQVFPPSVEVLSMPHQAEGLGPTL